jgi:hypothetical protein
MMQDWLDPPTAGYLQRLTRDESGLKRPTRYPARLMNDSDSPALAYTSDFSLPEAGAAPRSPSSEPVSQPLVKWSARISLYSRSPRRRHEDDHNAIQFD